MDSRKNKEDLQSREAVQLVHVKPVRSLPVGNKYRVSPENQSSPSLAAPKSVAIAPSINIRLLSQQLLQKIHHSMPAKGEEKSDLKLLLKTQKVLDAIVKKMFSGCYTQCNDFLQRVLGLETLSLSRRDRTIIVTFSHLISKGHYLLIKELSEEIHSERSAEKNFILENELRFAVETVSNAAEMKEVGVLKDNAVQEAINLDELDEASKQKKLSEHFNVALSAAANIIAGPAGGAALLCASKALSFIYKKMVVPLATMAKDKISEQLANKLNALANEENKKILDKINLPTQGLIKNAANASMENLQLLRGAFFNVIFSEEFIRVIATIEHHHLKRQWDKNILKEPAERCRLALKMKINGRLNKAIRLYSDRVASLSAKSYFRHKPSLNDPILDMFFIGLRMAQRSDRTTMGLAEEDINLLFERARAGNHHLITLVQKLSWIMGIRDAHQKEEFLEAIGCTFPKKSFYSALGCSGESKERKQRRKLAFVSMYIISSAIKKHCGTIETRILKRVPNAKKVEAVKAILACARYPLYSQDSRLILLRVFSVTPLLRQVLRKIQSDRLLMAKLSLYTAEIEYLNKLIETCNLTEESTSGPDNEITSEVKSWLYTSTPFFKRTGGVESPDIPEAISEKNVSDERVAQVDMPPSPRRGEGSPFLSVTQEGKTTLIL